MNVPDPPETPGVPGAAESRVEELESNQQVLGFMLALHGLVHMVGFLLEWRILEPAGMGYGDVWPDAGTWPGRAVGVAWLVVAGALVVVGARLANRRDVSAPTLVVPLVASIAVCATASPQALPGLLISASVLGALVVLRARRRARHVVDRPRP